MMMGMSTPPHAAMMGSSALRTSRSSPTNISYLISRPTHRKNSVISTLFTHSPRVRPK